MKKLVVFSFGLFLHFACIAQEGYYNVLLEHIGQEISLCENNSSRSYQVANTNIIEYYCESGNGLICIHIDGEMPHYSKLKFIKKQKDLMVLIKKMGLKKALSFSYDKLTPGMKTEEVRALLGKPYKLNYQIDDSDQILNLTYQHGLYRALVFRNDKLEKIIYE